jgi:peptidoglycan lytic transglycosylase
MLTFGSLSICCAAGPNPSSTNSVTTGKILTGRATIYPNRLNGHKTASGHKFHQSDHTAASNNLPLGTGVKVTSLKTGKSTSVTLTDRGPALGSHKIDLSKKAAAEIGLTRKQGTVPVKIKVTQPPGTHEAGHAH